MAGKTTAISMLCGLFEPSDGNAYVNGNSITNATELQAIHQTMGVCPQHDVLWSDLTAREHLLFYGRLKGEGWCDVGLPFDVLFSCSGLWFVGFTVWSFCFCCGSSFVLIGVLIGVLTVVVLILLLPLPLRHFFAVFLRLLLQDCPARDWCRKSSRCWPM